MSDGHGLLRVFKTIGLVLALGVSMTAFASLFSSGENWKEEVLLHDGSKLIVERSQTRGGNHEIGQPSPIKEWSITFTLPNSKKTITWNSKGWASSDTNGSSLGLLALDIVNSVPYIVTITGSCVDYNKWGRPNPPYVFFKYDGKAWQRIPLAEFPQEVKEANVVNDTDDHGHELDRHTGVVTTNEVNKMNGFYREEVLYQKVFVREPIQNAVTACSKFE